MNISYLLKEEPAEDDQSKDTVSLNVSEEHYGTSNNKMLLNEKDNIQLLVLNIDH